jgi:transcriptional regulator with XRE-family HTH domain
MAKKKATKSTTPKAPRAKGRRGGRKKGEWVLVTSDALRQYRKDAHLSRNKFAEILDVSATTIQNWESGKAVPTKKSQARLADLIKSGAPSASNGNGTVGKSAPRQVTSNGGAATDTQLTVTGEVLKAFLATARGGKTSPEQLVQLTKSLRAALA